jgi:hypothetical protein
LCPSGRLLHSSTRSGIQLLLPSARTRRRMLRRRRGQGHREDRLRLRGGRVSVPVAPKHLEPASRHRLLIPALGLNQILSWGSSYYLLAVLAGPIAADTGWPLPWITAGRGSSGLQRFLRT